MKKSAVKCLGFGLAILVVAPISSRAATVTLTNNDALGTSSLNAPGNWNNGAAPSSGNNYVTAGYLLRTPTSGATITFAGDSLRVGAGSGGGTFSPVTPNNNALLYKLASQTIIVTNLILDGSQIRDGNGDGQWAAINGNIFVTAAGGAFMAQATNVVNAALSGSSVIYIGDNGSGGAGRIVMFTSPFNTFTGDLVLTNSSNNATRSRLDLASGSVWNFVIGAPGVNNKIFGNGTLRLSGAFNIDLTGASTGLGDSWQLVGPSNANFVTTYNPSFSVNGFTDMGNDLWQKSANGTVYEFSELTGLLTVIPEPSSVALVLCGIAGLFASRRFRKG